MFAHNLPSSFDAPPTYESSKCYLHNIETIQWDENVNELKTKVKDQIEELATSWTREERDKCIHATGPAFRGGGGINGYLYGGNPH